MCTMTVNTKPTISIIDLYRKVIGNSCISEELYNEWYWEDKVFEVCNLTVDENKSSISNFSWNYNLLFWMSESDIPKTLSRESVQHIEDIVALLKEMLAKNIANKIVCEDVGRLLAAQRKFNNLVKSIVDKNT